MPLSPAELEAALQPQFSAVEDYLNAQLLPPDEALSAALADSNAAGLPRIQVSAQDGQLLNLLARLSGARRILEIGTLGGYSTICLARALPADGRLITLELEPRHAEVAAGNLARAGLADKVEIRVGRAIENLPLLEAEGAGPFDLVFIDADKPGNADYLNWALKLTRPGSLIIVDNVVRHGRIADPAAYDIEAAAAAGSATDESVVGVRRLMALLASEPRLSATAIQTVGSKGWDGLAIMLVNG